MTSNTTTMKLDKTFTKKPFLKYRNLKASDAFKGINGARLRIARKKDGSEDTVYKVNPSNWTDDASHYFATLKNPWKVPVSPEKKEKQKMKDTIKNDKKNRRKTTIDGGLLKPNMEFVEKPKFALNQITEWNVERAEAFVNINNKPEEPNTIYKYMTENEWSNAHWNKGSGKNLPIDCKNKYLQLNGGGKKQYNKEHSEYELKFYEVPSDYRLPDEEIDLGNTWIMKENPAIVAEWRGKYTEHRICGSVIVGVMIPKDMIKPDFQFNDPMRKGKHYLGKKIDIPQPKTHFEYRGIYELKETNFD